MFLKNKFLIIGLALVAAVTGWLYLNWTADSGTTPMGDGGASTAAIFALAASITSLAGSIIGVMMKFLEYKTKQVDLKLKERELDAK